VLGDLVTFLGPQFADKQVSLGLTVGRGPKQIRADSFQLKLALLNLLLNALQATPPGGAVEIATAGDGAQLSIEIRDSGEGVAPERIERVFDVFFTTREGGTGLGLPIARRIIDEHGGSLALESAPDRGTVARILLPGPGD
jgi:signal transduction histidine kinase